MPRLHDMDAIRTILRADPVWSIYALGDLEPGMFEHTEWYQAGSGLLLFFRGFSTPVLFAAGAAEDVAAALAETATEKALYLQVRPEVIPVLEKRYRIVELKPMLRMRLERFRPESGDGVVRLMARDLKDVEALYADGQESGESPDFFFPSMIEQGVFFGVREGGALVAAAGTHLISDRESVAAVGNVYTRRDRRGRGLGANTTSAVVAECLCRNLATVALNVSSKNAGAIRVYERLGFTAHCEYYEGSACG